jgi:indolepyruvate ferredoxin oxidoreductase, alpha subunit
MNPLLSPETGRKELLLGNLAIVRGAIEAGVGFVTCYPGTPSSEIPNAFFELAKESGIYFEFSTNEKVAMEVGAGAAVSGVRTLVTMKCVGLNVAADPLLTLVYVGVEGGMVVLSADEPSLHSTQNEQDTRLYGKLGYIPVLEPSTVQEAKDMTKYAFELSEAMKMPVILRTTTRVNHSRGVVTFGPLAERKTRGKFVKDPTRRVAIPAVSRVLRKELIEKHDRLVEMGSTAPVNFIEGKGRFGIITSGISYVHVADGLEDLGVKDKVAVLRLGLTYPFPARLVADFMRDKEKILVVEEVEPYMEEEANIVAKRGGIDVPIAGKGDDLLPRMFEFDPGMVRGAIARYFGFQYEPPQPIRTDDFPKLPSRPPTLCAGCPHRATLYAVTRAAGMDTPFPLEIGCYGLGYIPPLKASDFCICMGSAIPSGCGIAKTTGQKPVCFLGDSSFFHSGMTGLADAVHNKHNVLVAIMDNGTTAMTGHQDHPGMDPTSLGLDKVQIDIEAVCRGLGVQDIHVVRAFNLRQVTEATKKAMAFPGVSVIISKEPCPLFANKVGIGKKRLLFQVDQEKCTNCRDCINEIACPAFYLEDDRPAISADVCIGCSVCSQICSEKAIRPVRKGEPS